MHQSLFTWSCRVREGVVSACGLGLSKGGWHAAAVCEKCWLETARRDGAGLLSPVK